VEILFKQAKGNWRYIMKLNQKKSLSEEEAQELLKKDIEDFKQSVRDEQLRKKDLKELYSLEKSGKERENFLNFLVRYGKEEKVLRELDGFLDQVSRVDTALERMVEDESKNLDLEDTTDKTVKELKEYVKNNHLSKEELEAILESEKERKDRKTAKKYLEKELEDSSSLISSSEVKKAISNVENKVKSFKKDFIYHPEVFNLDNIEKEFEAHSEEQKDERDNDLEELVELTGNLVKNLKKSDNLENRGEMKELINNAILALESDNFDKFKDKIKRLNELTNTGKKNIVNHAETQQSKLQQIEEVISRLEETGYNAPREEKASEKESKSSESGREKMISRLQQEGFNREKLETRSRSDLEKLQSSSNKINNVEEMFQESDEMEKESERENSENRIIRDIEKLEEAIEKSE